MCQSLEVTGNVDQSQVFRRHDDRSSLVKRMISIAAALALLGPGTPSSAQSVGETGTSFPPDSVILGILRERVEEGRSVGIVVGLREADGETRVLAYGDPGPGKLPLDRESVFEIGEFRAS